ncbi:MAG: hypothetical protein JRI39_02710 [Deltaproteobacteria bacterium]|nr:hypothetical protein [Deltaproteobacteria bacterium]HDM09753.1 hypothetical protein [Desulfobacteraceae bacterium]
MRAYLIDEISRADMKKITQFLAQNAIRSSLSKIFWVKIPDDLLSPTQYAHHECQPHVFAVELGDHWVKLEFFVRSLKTMRCTCPGYCTEGQRNYVINFAHTMIQQLGIRT